MQRFCPILRRLFAVAIACSATLLTAQSKPKSLLQILNVPFKGVTDSFPTSVISATSTSNVWIVTPNKSLNFNGSTWMEQTLPSPFVIQGGVAAIASNNVWAVGYNFANGNTELVEHFDGKQWSLVQDVNLVGTQVFINGVTHGTVMNEALTSISAISANDIFAGGFVNTEIQTLPFVEHWNGTEWSVLPFLPIGGGQTVVVQSIAAFSDTDVWAVGSSKPNPSASIFPKSWHFNGKTWTEISGAPAIMGAFETITAIAPNDIWAGGYQEFPNVLFAPMAQHWNGTRWTIVPFPNPSFYPTTGAPNLSIAAVSSTSVWAVSTRLDPILFVAQPYVEHWNGANWNLEILPFCPAQECDLAAVTTLPTGQVWAAGYAFDLLSGILPNDLFNPFVLLTIQGK